MSYVDGFGTQLQRGDGATPEVFTKIAQVADLSAPGLKRDTYDATNHDSEAQHEEVVGGIIRTGELSLDIRYDPLIHDSLVADLRDAAARNYRLVFPTSPPVTWSLNLWLTGFEPSAPHDDLLSASVTFKVTGVPTIA